MLYHLQNNEARIQDNSSFGKNWQIMHLIWEQLARTTIAKNAKQPQHQHKKMEKIKPKKSAQQIKRMLHYETRSIHKTQPKRKSSYLHTIPYRQAMD